MSQLKIISASTGQEQDALIIHPLVMQDMGPEWVKAAITVREMLLAGELVEYKSEPDSKPVANSFWMTVPSCCIGGHIGKLLPERGDASPYLRAQPPKGSCNSITSAVGSLFSSMNPSDPIKAAEAIKEFLTTASVSFPWK